MDRRSAHPSLLVAIAVVMALPCEGGAAESYPSRGGPIPVQVGDPGDPAPADTIPADGAEPVEDFVAQLTDLGLRFRGRTEVGGEWTRFRPCDGAVQLTCDPGLVPQLQPDVQFGVEVAGTISDRIHVDVDYDETREFSATNTVNVFYEGPPGGFVERAEIGDVSLDLPGSRFFTQGIPAGNFGFRTDVGAGPLSLQTVWAEQSGDVSTRTLRIADTGGEQSFVQDDSLVVDDADYVRGQFFFLVDPRTLDGYPHVDALALSGAEAPADRTPGAAPIQLFRFEADPLTRQQVEGYVQADAVAGPPGDEIREAGWFRQLQPGLDYTVHASGLWVALRRPLTQEEMLAVSYITAAGDTVGTYDPERVHNAGQRPVLRLLKASGASHRPGRPTWQQEMHQVYRVSGSSGVDPGSVELSISLGEASAGRTFKRRPGGRNVTFLRLFGLDERAPADRLDRTAVYAPAEDYLLDRPALNGLFVVFPTLEPFGRPPPVRSEDLTAGAAAELLGADANPGIYDDPDPVERRNAGLYRLTLTFRRRTTDGLASFSLGALGIRDGSERIFLGERRLRRDIDYRIDYDVGQVTLLQPELLFAARPDAELRATWEQKEVFRVAPTSIFGLRGHYDLGERGGIDVVGLRQSERDLVNRPTLGMEPAAVSLGGLSSDLLFGADWLDRALEDVPGLRAGGASSVAVRSELGFSLPDPNTKGDVYLDDFDGSGDRPVSLRAGEWHLGSAPVEATGAEDVLPTALDEGSSAPLVWQHTWVQETTVGDSIGVFEGFLAQQDIDRQINVAGSQRREEALRLTFGDPPEAGEEPGEPFPEPRWRSITTLLGPSGLDLSRSEFLEFYVAEGDSLTLVVDLGEVSEDAFFVDAGGRVNGVKPETGAPWGLGILDQEADPLRGEIWSDAADARGVWDETCRSERARIYRIGDPRASCTRGNGRRDSEDLDQDGRLDQRDRHLRYVVELDGSSPFLVRTREETGTRFRLFRIPLRAAAGVPVGGFSPEADLRAVQHMRITVTGDRNRAVLLARMRIVGSRWTKRGTEGVMRGISGDLPGAGGRVEVGPVSRISEGAAYASPPGTREEADDPTAGLVGEGVEFQERALGLAFDDVASGDRAEVYLRFPQRPRDFLTYRRARLWVVGRGDAWGPERPLYFYVKVGNDPDNFYLHRTPLAPAADPDAVRPVDWMPEVEMDFDRWMELRRRAERELLEAPPDPGEGPVEVWGADSTHAVVLRDRGRAPSLAAVREISVGVWNESGVPVTGEVWVNDLRLASGLEDRGSAGYAEVDVRAGDVATARLSYADRGAFFRQLETGPSYQDDRDLRFSSTVHLDRFAPASWGLRAPVVVRHGRSDRHPHFLEGTDLRAGALTDVRTPEDRTTRIGVTVSRDLPSDSLDSWMETLVSGLTAGAGYTRAHATTVASERRSRTLDASLGWAVAPAPRRTGLVPGFLDGIFETLLPSFLERPLLEGRLRWNPERVSLRTAYVHGTSRTLRFEQIVRRPSDAGVRPVRSPVETLETAARVELQPFASLGADVDLLTMRDLLDPRLAAGDPAVRPLLGRERARPAGLDLGWETNRTLRTRLTWRPRLTEWLDTEIGATTRYGSFRDPNLVERRREGADTVLTLLRNVDGRRDLRASVSLDPGVLAERLDTGDGDGGPNDAGDASLLAGALGAVDRLSFGWEDGVTTRFDRRLVDPGTGFQLGWTDPGAYHVLDGALASVVVDRRALRAGGGLRLPLDLSIRIDYRRDDSRSLDAGSDRAVARRTWPDLSFGFGDLPLPGLLRPALARVSVRSGFSETRQRIEYGRGATQVRLEHAVEIPLEISVTWTGGLRTGYRGRFQRSAGRDPTGDTDRDRMLHGLTVSASFLPPGGWGPELERPVQASLSVQQTMDRDCRLPAAADACVAFVDQRNRSVHLTLDTSVQRLEVGFQMSWVDRQSFVDRHGGSTQFQLGVFGQFQLTAGDTSRL